MNHRIASACGTVVLLAAAAACGSSNNGASPTGSSTTGPQTTQQGSSGQFPGANGTIAAVDGSTAQVQSQQSGQVAVTWNGSTTFTKEVSATLADVKVGDCVMAMPAQSSTSSKVTAATVRITAATGGSCTNGLRGGPAGGQGPSFNGTPPSGAPTAMPSGAPGGQVRGSFGAFGKVTAVSGSGFTVSSLRPGSDTAAPVTVTTTSSTKYTTNAKASASDVKVGGCMSAQGTTDDTGAVTAKTVALSTPVDGQCGGGFFRSRSTSAGIDSGQAS